MTFAQGPLGLGADPPVLTGRMEIGDDLALLAAEYRGSPPQ